MIVPRRTALSHAGDNMRDQLESRIAASAENERGVSVKVIIQRKEMNSETEKILKDTH